MFRTEKVDGMKGSEGKKSGGIWKGLSARKMPGEAALCALAAAFCVLLCLSVGLTRTPRLYPVDYGQYERLLAQCSLRWTEKDLLAGDLQYVRPVTEFSYGHISWTKLLTPSAGTSLIYPVALIRLFTEPFGRPFRVDALAWVLAVLLALSAGLLTGALRRLLPRAWGIPAAVLCLLCLDGNFCAMLRGLYPVGAAAVYTVLYASVLLQGWASKPERRFRWVAAALICTLLLVKASAPLLVLLPALLILDAALFVSAVKASRLSLLGGVLCLFLGAAFCSGAVQQALTDPDLFSNAAAYESVFNAMLPAAEDPVSLLEELGLDGSYAPDIGRSFYEEEDVYAHDPRDPKEAETLFAALTPGRILGLYLRHPALLLRELKAFPYSMDSYENGRNSTLEPTAAGFALRRSSGGQLGLLRLLLHPSYVGFALAAAALLFGILLAGRKKRIRMTWAAAPLFASLYLPFALALGGYAQGSELVLYQVFLQDILAITLLSALVWAVGPVREWLLRYSSAPVSCLELSTPLRESEFSHRSFRVPLPGKGIGRRALSLCFVLLSLLMLAAVFLPEHRPGCVNNGDFGRMMDQLDITWSGDLYYDTGSQAGRFLIEEYSYLAPFDLRKLTPLKPTYSLYWFTGVVRLLTEPFGLPFDTRMLAWVMGVVAAACIGRLVYDLLPKLGRRWTLFFGCLLCAVFMSETYLTWYNSLYGESCILLGLLMSLCCAVHLSLMPKGGWKPVLWLLGLILSLNILVTAKAQMLVALPGALGLLLLMAWRHRPYRYDLQLLEGLLALALCAVLVFSGVRVYRSDRTADSVSQRHTMWQAYFYGIFMISDDPIGDMEALGVDTAMAPDIGKYVSFGDDIQYVYAPLSPEAQTGFYDHVSMGTILKWYLTHPGKLWKMLDHAASVSRRLYTDFRVYRGQDYASPGHDPVDGFDLWPGWRSCLSPGSFLGYVLLYGCFLFVLLRRILRRGREAGGRLLSTALLFVLLTGVLQFPLSVLGNGFADNQKQLFGFALCHDVLLCFALTCGLRALAGKTPQELKKRLGGKVDERKADPMDRDPLL